MNIVVGENNSGKSNLIDVLELVDIIVSKGKDLNKSLIDRGGFEKFLNYRYIEDMLRIELTLEDDYLKTIRRLSLSQDIIIFSRIVYQKIGNKFNPSDIIASRVNLKSKWKKTRYYLFKKNIKSENIDLEILKSHTRLEIPIKTYSFNIEKIRSQSHKESIKELKKDGSNLGKNLFNIKNNYPNTFELISNSMIGIVNEIDAVDVQETFGNYLIGFNEKNKQIGIDMVSDGTINLLATITALNQEDDESLLLAFDEPERYLHLKAVNYLLESFRASEKQILITTHSTEILKYANLDEIIFIYRDADGDTQSIRANKIEGLKDMLKELSYERDLTLDELIADGVIGDFK